MINFGQFTAIDFNNETTGKKGLNWHFERSETWH